jgi:hypothetical protein
VDALNGGRCVAGVLAIPGAHWEVDAFEYFPSRSVVLFDEDGDEVHAQPDLPDPARANKDADGTVVRLIYRDDLSL